MSIPNVPQLDGSRFEGYNCNMAAAADAILYTTGGHRPSAAKAPWPPTGASVRALTHDVIGGTDLPEADAAANAGYATDLIVQLRYPIASLNSKLASGWGAVCVIMYSVIQHTSLDADGGKFGGSHSIFRAQGLVSDPLADGRREGIPKGPAIWPESTLERAMFAYEGAGFCQVALVPPPHVAIPHVRVIGPFSTWTVRTTPAPAHTIGSTANRKAPYNTIWSCKPPVGIRNGRALIFLSQLTSGPYAGLYVFPHGNLRYSE